MPSCSEFQGMPASPKFYFGVDGHSARSMELRNCSTLCGISPRWLGNCDADWMQTEAQNRLGKLGGVDKFKPVSGSGEMDHAEEAIGQLVVAGGDGAVDLEVTEHALDAVALLIEHPVMFDLHATV